MAVSCARAKSGKDGEQGREGPFFACCLPGADAICPPGGDNLQKTLDETPALS